MANDWWWNKVWEVRNDIPLRAILSRGDTLSLEPNTMMGNPSFFWIRFKNDDPTHASYWKNSYVYAVGVEPPPIKLEYDWDDSRPPEDQKDRVNAHYNDKVRQVRAIAGNPYTERLEGHIKVDSHLEIIRLFFFKGAQPCGKDWFVIDALQLNEISAVDRRGEMEVREDGSAHGDTH